MMLNAGFHYISGIQHAWLMIHDVTNFAAAGASRQRHEDAMQKHQAATATPRLLARRHFRRAD